jgi:hypothetical protein
LAARPAHRPRALALSIVLVATIAATAHAAPLRGTPLDDRIAGTSGPDEIQGGAGDDVLIGRGAADLLGGGRGKDRLLGGPGADVLVGGPGADRLRGGPGADLVRARNGGRDRVDCGPGRDTAILDANDVAAGCEAARRPRPATPANTPAAAGPAPATGAAPAPATTASPDNPGPADPDPPADPAGDPPVDPLPPLPPDDYPQLLAAGDIADCTAPPELTAQILDGLRGTVTPLGDTAYPTGSYEDFMNCYEPTWGRHKHRTRPAVGSHEYDTPGAAPYWQYFGTAAGEAGEGWYSYDVGGWHVIVLNSACAEVGGCSEGSPQLEWLRDDLAAHPALCTATYWHIPRYSSGKKHGDDLAFVPFWQVLYEHGVEFVMGGNDHHYERFAPQTPYGDPDPTDGVRQFVVGTGGRFLREMSIPPHANSEAGTDQAHGILRVALQEQSYEWEFVPIAGSTYTDSGSTACH